VEAYRGGESHATIQSDILDPDGVQSGVVGRLHVSQPLLKLPHAIPFMVQMPLQNAVRLTMAVYL